MKLSSNINSASEEFAANRELHLAALSAVKDAAALAAQGGGKEPANATRHGVKCCQEIGWPTYLILAARFWRLVQPQHTECTMVPPLAQGRLPALV